MPEIESGASPEDTAAEPTTADLARDMRLEERPAEGRAFSAPPSPTESATADSSSLFPLEQADGLRRQWTQIQAEFVDEPRKAVEDADGLVANAIEQLARMFADERSKLERGWDRDGEVSTEDLRQALQHYRSFFTRLLAI